MTSDTFHLGPRNAGELNAPCGRAVVPTVGHVFTVRASSLVAVAELMPERVCSRCLERANEVMEAVKGARVVAVCSGCGFEYREGGSNHVIWQDCKTTAGVKA